MLKAIAHPVRMAIVSLLEGDLKLTVTEIHQKLKLEQAVASHHLSILKSRGVVDSDRQGKSCFYFLCFPSLIEVIACVGQCCTNSTQNN